MFFATFLCLRFPLSQCNCTLPIEASLHTHMRIPQNKGFKGPFPLAELLHCLTLKWGHGFLDSGQKSIFHYRGNTQGSLIWKRWDHLFFLFLNQGLTCLVSGWCHRWDRGSNNLIADVWTLIAGRTLVTISTQGSIPHPHPKPNPIEAPSHGYPFLLAETPHGSGLKCRHGFLVSRKCFCYQGNMQGSVFKKGETTFLPFPQSRAHFLSGSGWHHGWDHTSMLRHHSDIFSHKLTATCLMHRVTDDDFSQRIWCGLCALFFCLPFWSFSRHLKKNELYDLVKSKPLPASICVGPKTNKATLTGLLLDPSLGYCCDHPPTPQCLEHNVSEGRPQQGTTTEWLSVELEGLDGRLENLNGRLENRLENLDRRLGSTERGPELPIDEGDFANVTNVVSCHFG